VNPRQVAVNGLPGEPETTRIPNSETCTGEVIQTSAIIELLEKIQDAMSSISATKNLKKEKEIQRKKRKDRGRNTGQELPLK